MRMSRTSSTYSLFIEANVDDVTVDVVAPLLLGMVIIISAVPGAPPSGCCCNKTFWKQK
jgi:hypothetical protein